MYHPFLVGEKIYLRGLEEKDIEGKYFQWFNDSEVCKYNDHFRFPNNKQKMVSYLETIFASNNNLVLAIVQKKDDVHVGNISLQNIDWINRNAEFAILLGEKEYWGQGIAEEAGELIIAHGFEELGLVRVCCGTSENNIGMQKLALKLGMQEEGRRKKAIFKSGDYLDIIEYGLVKKD